jgi:hypothetical protein
MAIKMTPNSNPLRKHFRQPAIYIRLPSGGKHYPLGALDLPPNGEIPVFPMTAMDEISSRTPDALFNGSVVVDLIRSCVPNIRDPWVLPSIDLNALFVAMRVASYGHNMEINSKCPSCGHEHSFELDLRRVIDTLKSADYDKPMQLGDLTFYFAPLNYQAINDISRSQFEDQKITSVISQSEMPEEEKIARLGEAYKRITELTFVSVARSIAAIKTADAMVTEFEHIKEFVENCTKSQYDMIRDHAVALRTESDLKPLDITCANCANKYKQEFTLDMSNFFETNS